MAAAVGKNGSGIRETAPGRLTVTMYDPRAKGKTRHVGTIYFPPTERKSHNWYPTKAKAERAARKLKDAQERQRDLELKGTAKETIREFAKRWPDEYTERRSQSTLTHNAERIRALVRDFGDRPLWDGIPKIEARAWIMGGVVPQEIAHIARDWDGAKVRGKDVEVPEHTGNHLAVRAMFNDALKTDLTRMNPFATLNVPEKQGRRGDAITVLEPEEIDLLIQTANDLLGGEYGAHYGALIQLAAWTGLRPGELWALNIEKTSTHNWFDLDAGILRVDWQLVRAGQRSRPKWKSMRTVTLLPPAVTALTIARAGRPSGELFQTRRGIRMLNMHNSHYWAQVRSAFWEKLPPERQSKTRMDAGGPELGKIPADFDFYELRHAYGTMLAEMEETAPKIAKLMGHKDGGELAMKRYIHPSEKAVQDSVLQKYEAWQRRRAIGE